jgi:hypothetical protein
MRQICRASAAAGSPGRTATNGLLATLRLAGEDDNCS